MKDIVIYGAGGHARVIIDIIEQSNSYRIVGLVNDMCSSAATLMGYPVVSDIGEFCGHGVRSGLIAIGDNWQRSRLASTLTQRYGEFEFVTAVHPSVRIGRAVVIGAGTVVMAGCNINPQATIKNHCIINTGTNVDHDCIIGDNASLAPGVTLGGNVIIGDFTAVGLGTAVIHKIEIGEHVVVGAGSVVVKNIIPHCIAYGNPCKAVKARETGSPYL